MPLFGSYWYKKSPATMMFYHNNRNPKTDTFQINSVSTTNPKTSKNKIFPANKSSWSTEKPKSTHPHKEHGMLSTLCLHKMNLKYKPKQ